MRNNQRVRLLAAYHKLHSDKTLHIDGTIVGAGFINDETGMRPIYLVKLDQGFYNPTGITFVSTLVVDRDCAELTPIE